MNHPRPEERDGFFTMNIGPFVLPSGKYKENVYRIDPTSSHPADAHVSYGSALWTTQTHHRDAMMNVVQAPLTTLMFTENNRGKTCEEFALALEAQYPKYRFEVLSIGGDGGHVILQINLLPIDTTVQAIPWPLCTFGYSFGERIDMKSEAENLQPFLDAFVAENIERR